MERGPTMLVRNIKEINKKKIILFLVISIFAGILMIFFQTSEYSRQKKVLVVQIYESLKHQGSTSEVERSEPELIGAGTATIFVVRKSTNNVEDDINFSVQNLLLDGWEIKEDQRLQDGYIGLIKGNKTISFKPRNEEKEYVISCFIK